MYIVHAKQLASNPAKVLHFRQTNFVVSKFSISSTIICLWKYACVNNQKISAAAARLPNIQISMIGVALQVGQVRELERKET